MGFSFGKASVGQRVKSTATGDFGTITEVDLPRDDVLITWDGGEQSLLYGEMCEVCSVEFVEDEDS